MTGSRTPGHSTRENPIAQFRITMVTGRRENRKNMANGPKHRTDRMVTGEDQRSFTSITTITIPADHRLTMQAPATVRALVHITASVFTRRQGHTLPS